MEYEISDEERLFDDSTNPSLLPENRAAEHSVSSAKPQADRKLQKAELIPEEEHQLA